MSSTTQISGCYLFIMDLKQLLTPSPFSHNPQKRKSYNYNIHKHRRIEDLYLLVKEKTILRVILGRWLDTEIFGYILCIFVKHLVDNSFSKVNNQQRFSDGSYTGCPLFTGFHKLNCESSSSSFSILHGTKFLLQLLRLFSNHHGLSQVLNFGSSYQIF